MIIAQLCLSGIAFAAAPRLSPTLVERTRSAVEVLLTPPPLSSKASVRKVEAAMTQIQRGLDAYFHAPNLLEARAEALEMRQIFRALRQGDQPRVALVDDVLRFDPNLHDALAEACASVDDRGCALQHRLLALISGPTTPTRVTAARAALPSKDQAAFDERFGPPAPVSVGSHAPASRPE